MSAAKHTPGPWILGNENNQCCDVDLGNECTIGMSRNSAFGSDFKISREEMLANAHLVIAAPDMLSALEMVLDADKDRVLDGFPTQFTSLARFTIECAIAKARGES